MSKVYREIAAIRRKLESRGIEATNEQVSILRCAEMTLHRWAEQECGDGNDYGSWCITRDETTGKPYREYHPNNGNTVTRTLIADREAGALKRIAKVCAEIGAQFYHQTDPRGCALYVYKADAVPAGSNIDSLYSSIGAAICA